jgi:hypothetical protein
VAKFKVQCTRLIEQSCEFYVDAQDPAEAIEKAIDTVEEVADSIWSRTTSEPHQYDVGEVNDAAQLSKE